MNRLTSQPSSRNCTASQSSSSGWLGGSPCEPKSSAVLTMPGAEDLEPEPVDRHPGRQRVVRARPASWASPSRLTGAPGGSGGRNAGVARPTLSRRWSYSPRLRMKAGLSSPPSLAEDQGRRDLLVDLPCAPARPCASWARSGSNDRACPGVGVLDEVGEQLLLLGLGPLRPLDRDDRLEVRPAAPRRRRPCWARTQAVSES